MAVSVAYKLVGTGWCECTLDVDGHAVTVTGSYLSDPLYEFCAAVQALLDGSDSVRFSFEEEPGEYRWVFKIIGPGVALLTILVFEDNWSNTPPDSEGSLIFERPINVAALGHALHAAMAQLLKDYGEEGYKEKWVQYPFPSERHQQLGFQLGS